MDQYDIQYDNQYDIWIMDSIEPDSRYEFSVFSAKEYEVYLKKMDIKNILNLKLMFIS